MGWRDPQNLRSRIIILQWLKLATSNLVHGLGIPIPITKLIHFPSVNRLICGKLSPKFDTTVFLRHSVRTLRMHTHAILRVFESIIRLLAAH